MFVAAKGDVEKVDPTQKTVIYGGVVEQPTAYSLLWTQVGLMGSRMSSQAQRTPNHTEYMPTYSACVSLKMNILN